ncbi:hypothetical protein KR084_003990, partial [Drosophila pseudotakahashii]
GLGKASILEHAIEISPESKPVKQRYFSVSPAIEKKIHSEIDDMLKMGIIEKAPATCSWSSPVAVVQKGEKFRICLDSHKVNAVTIKDAPIAFFSHKLNQQQQKYCVTELECLAAVLDDIERRKRSLNVVPDALSRLPTKEISELDVVLPQIDLDSPHFWSSAYVRQKNSILENQNRLPDLKVVDQYIYNRN